MLTHDKHITGLAALSLAIARPIARSPCLARGRTLLARLGKKLLHAIAVAAFFSCARFARFIRSRYARHRGVRPARTLARLPQFSICSRTQTTAAACAPYRKPKKASPHCASYASTNSPNGTAICVVAVCVVAVCLGVFPPKPLHAAPSAAAPIRALASLFVSFAVCGSWRFPCAYAQAPSTDFAVSCGRGWGSPLPCLARRLSLRSPP